MLSSITPLGERGRNNPFAIAASFFIAGALLGGLATGAVVGGAGALVVPDSAVADGVVIVIAALTGAVLDARFAGARLPTITRQVDENWLQKYRPWVYGLGFGFQLGTGLATIVSSAAVYLMIIAALLTRSMVAGALIGAVFGGLRGLSILLARHIVTYEELRRFHARLAAHSRHSVAVNVTTQGVISIVGVVAVVSVVR